MNENETDDRIEALSQLKREIDTPPELENRVIARLLEKGLLRDRSSGRRVRWFTVAAAVLIFAFGFGSGKFFVTRVTGVQYTYVLFLREDPQVFEKPIHEPSLVREYAQWARNISQSGTMIRGEKLSSQSRLIASQKGKSAIEENVYDSVGAIAGFFLLKASSDKEALDTALGCPHLRHGGTIELRRIEILSN